MSRSVINVIVQCSIAAITLGWALWKPGPVSIACAALTVLLAIYVAAKDVTGNKNG